MENFAKAGIFSYCQLNTSHLQSKSPHAKQFIHLFIIFTTYGTLEQKPKDEMQKSQRPHIKTKHQWYLEENNDAKLNYSD